MKQASINPRKSRFRRILILLSFVAAFSLLFCLFLVYHLFFSDLFQKSETLIVPDLTGIVFEDTLPHESAGFQIVRIGCYDDAPIGTVLSQSPEAGSKRKIVKGKRYATLTLYISKGRELAPVPLLIGRSIESSTCELLSHGFSYQCEECFDDAPRGTVIAQSVTEGSLFPKGGSITLTVSLGQEVSKLRVPSLSGFTEIQARSLIEASELRIGSVTYERSMKNSGEVISQFPLPGMLVPRKTAIALTIARSPSNEPYDGPQESDKPDDSVGEATEPQTDPEENDPEDLLNRLFRRHSEWQSSN